MNQKRASIYDIAKEAGMSVATVSRTINNPDKVNIKTRTKIHAIMERLNYTPNALAQSLVSRSTKTIGVFIAKVQNPFYAEMLHAIEKFAFDNQYSILFGNTFNDIQKEEHYVDLFLKKQVDGIIFAGGRNLSEAHSEHIMKTAERVPVVLTNHSVVGKNIYSVISDEAEGTALAVQHLIDTGRSKIAFIYGYDNSYPSVVKKDSYFKTLSRNHLAVDDNLIIKASDDTMEGGYNACGALLSKGAEFDALFATNDLMAIGAMKKLIASGIQIPQNVSVVGYDDIQFCKYISPSLSSVTQNMSDLGSMAVQILNEVLEGKNVQKIKYLQPHLKIRESSMRA